MNGYEKKLLDEYQVRKTRAQKSAFIEFLREKYPDMHVEKGALGCRNIVIGDPDSADVIFGAHYDTCVRMMIPNFIMPKRPYVQILYALLLVIPLLAVMIAVKAGLTALGVNDGLSSLMMLIVYFGLFALMFFVGPANKHTANDNTSGVLAVLRIADSCKEAGMTNAAFVLFDNEEYGCIGSVQFRKRHKKHTNDALVFNLDCIGDGAEFLIIANKKATERCGDALKEAFSPAYGRNAELVSAKKVMYTSDQKNFPVSVAAAAFRRHPRFGLYLNRIHTSRDTVCEPDNINYVTEGALKFMNTLK